MKEVDNYKTDEKILEAVLVYDGALDFVKLGEARDFLDDKTIAKYGIDPKKEVLRLIFIRDGKVDYSDNISIYMKTKGGKKMENWSKQQVKEWLDGSHSITTAHVQRVVDRSIKGDKELDQLKPGDMICLYEYRWAEAYWGDGVYEPRSSERELVVKIKEDSNVS